MYQQQWIERYSQDHTLRRNSHDLRLNSKRDGLDVRESSDGMQGIRIVPVSVEKSWKVDSPVQQAT